MSDIDAGYSVKFIGPFIEKWHVMIDGFVIPRLTAVVVDEGRNINLCLDDRFMQTGTPEECAKWVSMIANALAIGEGYSWYGAQSKVRPFAPQGHEISARLEAPVLDNRLVASVPDNKPKLTLVRPVEVPHES